MGLAEHLTVVTFVEGTGIWMGPRMISGSDILHEKKNKRNAKV